MGTLRTQVSPGVLEWDLGGKRGTLRLRTTPEAIHFELEESPEVNGNSTDVKHANPYTFGLFLNLMTPAIVAEIQEYFCQTIAQESWYKYEVQERVDALDIGEVQAFVADDISPARPFLHTVKFIRFWCELYAACFPVLSRITLARQSSIAFSDGFYSYSVAPDYRPSHAARTMRDFITKNYGQYHRGIARLLSEYQNHDHFEMGYVLKDFADLSYIYEAMKHIENPHRSVLFEPCDIDAEAIQTLSPTVKRHLVRDSFNTEYEVFSHYEGSVVTDASYMVGVAPNKSVFSGVKTWTELHDRAMEAVVPALPGMVDHHHVELPSLIQKLEGSTICDEKYTLHTMNNVDEFIRVGEVMQNCIGSASYYAQTKRHKSYCLNIRHNGEMYGCVQVEPVANGWKIAQLRGYKNAELPDGALIHTQILRALGVQEKDITPFKARTVTPEQLNRVVAPHMRVQEREVEAPEQIDMDTPEYIRSFLTQTRH